MSAFDSAVKRVSNLPAALGATTKAGSTSVTLATDQTVDIAPFSSQLTPVHQWAHMDNGQFSGQIIMAAPFDSTKKIHLLDMILSTDTAQNLALYQAILGNYGSRISTDGGANLWKLDDASGNAADSIGSATLTATATPTYAAESWVCADGKSVSLNGSTQGFKTNTKLASTATGAFECWFWLDTVPDEEWMIASASDTAGANDFFHVSILTTRQPYLLIKTTAGGYTQNIIANFYCAYRQWYHMVWQMDGTIVSCYINGRRVSLTVNNTSTGWYDGPYSVVDNFSLGYDAGPSNLHFFQGKLCLCAWYTAAKSADVWASHYEYGAPVFGPHYFPANGGIAQPQRIPAKLRAGQPVYARSSTAGYSTIEVYGYEA